MVWIRSMTNGNVFDVEDVDRANQLVTQGHEAFESDPRRPGAKPLRPAAVSSGTPIVAQPKASGGTTPAGLPEGEPTAEWSVKQLRAYAKGNTIDLDGARTKPEILAVLLTAGEDDDEDLDDEDLGDDEDLDELDDDEDLDDESDAPVDDEDEPESKDS